MSQVINVSRRGFLVGWPEPGPSYSRADVPSCVGEEIQTDSTQPTRRFLHPNVFVGIDTDGTVYIIAIAPEMGTVIRTSCPSWWRTMSTPTGKRVKIEPGHWCRAIR